MKHIKLFESFEDDTYFEIDEKEYRLKTWGFLNHDLNIDILTHLQNMLDFTNSTWQSFSNREKRILRRDFSVINKYKKNGNDISLRISSYRMDLIKAPDEWFYIKSSIEGSKEEDVTYYKCDQFDGLIDCLNDLKIKYK